MKQLQELLEWLDSFENLPFEPTRQNVVEKIWQLQSEIKREQCNIADVSNNEVALIEPLRNFIRSKHLSKEWETFLKDYERNL